MSNAAGGVNGLNLRHVVIKEMEDDGLLVREFEWKRDYTWKVTWQAPGKSPSVQLWLERPGATAAQLVLFDKYQWETKLTFSGGRIVLFERNELRKPFVEYPDATILPQGTPATRPRPPELGTTKLKVTVWNLSLTEVQAFRVGSGGREVAVTQGASKGVIPSIEKWVKTTRIGQEWVIRTLDTGEEVWRFFARQNGQVEEAGLLEELPASGPPTRSHSTGESTRIRFVNDSSGSVEIRRIDGQGNRRTYGTVQPDANLDVTSRVGELWVAVQGGRDLVRFVAESVPKCAWITGPR